MENNRNYFIAIGLSILILIGWQVIYVNPKLEEERQIALAQQEQEAATAELNGTATATDPSLPQATAGAATELPGDQSVPASEKISRQDALSTNKRIIIETPSLSGSLNLKGARFDDLILKNYREELDKNSPNVVLFSPAESQNGYFSEVGYIAPKNSGVVPNSETEWTVKSGKDLTPTTPIVLSYDNGAGLIFDRTISVDDKYLFTVEDTITNASGAQVSISPYGRVKRLYKPQTTGIYILHEGLLGFLGEEGLQEIDYGDVEDDGIISPAKTATGWLGITDKYWAAALVPEQGRAFQPRFGYFANGTPSYQTDYLSDAIVIASDNSASVKTHIFAGAKTVPEINKYQDEQNIDQFDLMIDWGWFYFITKPMFHALHFFFELFGNFGISILVTTVVVKAIFFPLANKSYKSMANMKKVQPQMEELKKKHGDDRQALQQAMMQLYKTEKVNPVAGCWPVLLQIPVFFALYKVLYVSIEMRHAPFFGWIQDLSAPDPTTVFNLFGLLPFDPTAIPVIGFILAIGVWPLIMGITMFLQMRMNPTPPDPTQAMIFTWMPIVFTFMLATFPAGLVIYWAWNNSLSIIQQGVIMKRQGVKIELWDNLKSLFSRKKDPAA
ncbi:membrane protein insertase YidC [Lentilitoribacter sp. Alg239-R112]|uniref:membrane protein insertase YidC n=1 Tax=Lentilitoribacter sp. Alg239-R112 TaxID=2305987 RepID=UPI0013A702EC|nr:membrane protein insertase YidC [Lentilitoribacter sp. Alg239-R112]